jgi:hypothetical protein
VIDDPRHPLEPGLPADHLRGLPLLAYLTGEARIAVSTVLFLVWPFVFIWFADDLSSTTGTYLHYRRVSRVSPVLLVKLFGFVILLTPPVVALLYR